MQDVIAMEVANEKRIMAMSFFMVVSEFKWRFTLRLFLPYFGSTPCPPPFITVLGVTSSSVQAVTVIEVANAKSRM